MSHIWKEVWFPPKTRYRTLDAVFICMQYLSLAVNRIGIHPPFINYTEAFKLPKQKILVRKNNM